MLEKVKAYFQTEQKPQTDQNPSLPLRQIKSEKNYLNRLDFVENSLNFSGGSRKRSGGKLVAWTFVAAVIDLCFILMTTFVLSIFLLKVLKNGISLQTSLFFIFLNFSISYYLATRLYVGSTLGEWACYLRLGQPTERANKKYIFKVFLRLALHLATGFIILPILSIIFKKDIAGLISGLKIYSLK